MRLGRSLEELREPVPAADGSGAPTRQPIDFSSAFGVTLALANLLECCADASSISRARNQIPARIALPPRNPQLRSQLPHSAAENHRQS